MRLARTLGLAVGLAAAASMALAAGASAQPIEHTTFHDEETSIQDDFCDVSGLTVQVDQVVDGRRLVNPHGPDGLAYRHENFHLTAVVTNVDNGIRITEVDKLVVKDLRVTDNGDGTLTILVLLTGSGVVYGPDGEAIARNPGQVRFERLIDHGGTPTDPSDDVLLEERFVKGSTGRSDDFCEAVVPVLVG